MAGSILTLRVPDDFVLGTAVCSYGFFRLAPNRWDAAAGRFGRPLRVGQRRSGVVQVVVGQGDRRTDRLRLRCDRRVSATEAATIRRQVGRMLRVDEDQSGFHRVCPAARRRGFGRMFRSPDLWEDMVKTVTSCNVSWPNTIAMNRLLVERVGDGAWPTPVQVVRFGADRLAAECRVGYRAGRMVRLAEAFVDGLIDPVWFQSPRRTAGQLYDAVRSIHGFGPYAANNMLQLLGHYDRLPIDSEVVRHFCAKQGIERPKNPAVLHGRIERHYARYRPYAFKAYWCELWHGDVEA